MVYLLCWKGSLQPRFMIIWTGRGQRSEVSLVKFTDTEVLDIGCSEPCLVLKAFVEYCFYPISLKEHEKAKKQGRAVTGGVLSQGAKPTMQSRGANGLFQAWERIMDSRSDKKCLKRNRVKLEVSLRYKFKRKGK